MPVSADQLEVARSWIGTSESEPTFSARYDRFSADPTVTVPLDAAIIESIRAQLAVLVLDQPAQLSTPDGMSVNYTANIAALRDQLKAFIDSGGTGLIPTAMEASVVRMHRQSRR